MQLKALEQRIQQVTEQLGTLRDHPPPLTPHLVDNLVNELHTTLGALNTAHEGIRQQAEMLEEARAAAEREKTRYSELFEFAPDAYLITDKRGLIYAANRAAAALFNLEAKQLTGKPIATYILAEDRPKFFAFLHRLTSAETELSFETRLQPRDQAFNDVAIKAARIFSAVLTNPEQFMWLIRDITPHKEAEARERDHYYTATFEQAAVGMAHLAANGRWLRVNKKLGEILGYDAEEFLTMKFESVIHPDDLAHFMELHRQLVSGESQPKTAEIRYFRSDGSMIWTRTTLSAVYSPDRHFMYNMVVVDDTTERKRLEIAEHEQRIMAEVLRDIALHITSTLDFKHVVEHIFESIGRVVPHDAALLLLIEDNEAHIVQTKGYRKSGLHELKEALFDLRLTLPEPELLDRMIETRQILLLPHWQATGVWQQLEGIDAIASFVGAPIVEHDKVIGFIHLHSTTPAFFQTRIPRRWKFLPHRPLWPFRMRVSMNRHRNWPLRKNVSVWRASCTTPFLRPYFPRPCYQNRCRASGTTCPLRWPGY